MIFYYVNRQAQMNGDNEVHQMACGHLPSPENRQLLGTFENCHEAVRDAQRYYQQVNGCFYCARPCHTQ